jgi:predicted ATPase
LSGEAGIGKSRIVRAVRDLVGREGHFQQHYQCSPFHPNSALYPIIQQLEHATGITAGDEAGVKLDKLEALLEPSAVDLQSIAPLFAALLSLPAEDRYGALDLTPGQRRDHTFAALMGQVLALSRQRPVLFVIEDVHWIDPTTQDFIAEVIGQIADAPVFVLVTHRPEYVPLWSGHAQVTSLALNRLSRRQAGEIVESVAGAKLSGAMVAKIVARADGVPLFVEELAKSVREAGQSAGGPVADDAIPATLQASLTARLDRLGSAKGIAQVGAAIGREYSHELIAAVSREDEASLSLALDRLVEAGLVFRTATAQSTHYTFKHALIQEIAYESMLKSRRSQLHLQIAEVLETAFPATAEAEPEVLARHYSLANMVAPAIAYWRRAGELSAGTSANIEAVSHFENALNLVQSLPDGTERDQLELELRIALGGPLLMTRGHGAPEVGGTYSRARELCRKIGDSPQIVPALFGMWRYYIGRGDCTVTRDLGAQLLELGKHANDTPSVVLGHYGLGFALFCFGDLKAARSALENGYKLYDRTMRDNLSFRLGQDPGVACLSYCALALWVLGYPDQALRTSQQALALAEELSHPFSSAYALSLACQVLQHRGEIDDVRHASEAAIEIAREQGFSVWIASPTIFKGWVRSQQDNAVAGAEEANEGVQAIVDAGMEMRRPYYLALVAECEILAGRFAEAKSILEQARAIVAETDEHWSEAELMRLTGEIEARDDQASAEATFRGALAIARAQDAKSWELRCATSLARLWRSQGKSDHANTLLRPVYDWFSEGFDTPDLKAAKALLDELS